MEIFAGQGDFLSNSSAVGKVAFLMKGDLVVVAQLACFAAAVSITPFVTYLNGLFLSTLSGVYMKVELPPARIMKNKTPFSVILCVNMTVTTNGVHKSVPSALPLVQKLSKDHDLVLKTFRLLIADLCQQFSGGHPGYDKDLSPLFFL